MAGIGPGDLHDLAQEFLDACIEALDTIPDYDNTLHGAPDRTLVAPGTVVLDCCDQLAVNVGPIGERAIGPHASGRVNDVELIATASRCVAMMGDDMVPPNPAEQNESGRQVNADKWALWNHIYSLIQDGELFEKCCGVTWIGLEPLVPSGGCGGSTLTLRVCFDGYERVQGT